MNTYQGSNERGWNGGGEREVREREKEIVVVTHSSTLGKLQAELVNTLLLLYSFLREKRQS